MFDEGSLLKCVSKIKDSSKYFSWLLCKELRKYFVKCKICDYITVENWEDNKEENQRW